MYADLKSPIKRTVYKAQICVRWCWMIKLTLLYSRMVDDWLALSIRYRNAIFAQSVVTTHFLHSALALLGHSEKHPVKAFKVRFTRHYGFLTQGTKRIIYTKFNSLNTFLHAALSLGFTHSRTGCSVYPVWACAVSNEARFGSCPEWRTAGMWTTILSCGGRNQHYGKLLLRCWKRMPLFRHMSPPVSKHITDKRY